MARDRGRSHQRAEEVRATLHGAGPCNVGRGPRCESPVSRIAGCGKYCCEPLASAKRNKRQTTQRPQGCRLFLTLLGGRRSAESLSLWLTGGTGVLRRGNFNEDLRRRIMRRERKTMSKL